MNTTYELNNLRKDELYMNRIIKKDSIISEVFNALVAGKELPSKAGVDMAVNEIKAMGERAKNGDPVAIAELNTLRRFYVEPLLKDEMKLLGVFGNYTAVGFDETIEREVPTYNGEMSRMQATAGDVVFPAVTVERYNVPTFTVSGGYAVDYRRVELGDMSRENEGMEQVRIDMRNRAAKAIVQKIYNAVKNATGVKYLVEDAGLTKTNVDAAIANVRRVGRPTVVGDYALLSQFTPWAGYVGSIANNTITGISEAVMNQIAQNGLLGMYNGTVLAEIDNAYDYSTLNAAGTNFETMWPTGIAFIVPTGIQSPIATYTRGGITSFTGNNVKNGKVETRFDIEVGCDIAKGREFQIGVIRDTNLSPL